MIALTSNISECPWTDPPWGVVLAWNGSVTQIGKVYNEDFTNSQVHKFFTK